MIEFIVWAMLNFGGIYFGAWGIYLWWKYKRKPVVTVTEGYEPVVIELAKIPAGAKITGITLTNGTLHVDLENSGTLTVDVAEKMRDYGRDAKGR